MILFALSKTTKSNAGQKPFTKLQEKQWTKVRDDFQMICMVKYLQKTSKSRTEEFLPDFCKQMIQKAVLQK